MNSLKQLVVVVCIILLSAMLAGCMKTSLPTGPGATWDVVVIGDSTMWELATAYAAVISRDMGVAVRVHDFALSTLSAGEVLEVLKTGNSHRVDLIPLPDALKEAEVVVMHVNPNDSGIEGNPIDMEGCFMITRAGSCDESQFIKYQSDVESIWTQIIQLRGNKEIILRATDMYNPLISHWVETGIEKGCNECWTIFSKINQKAADNMGVPFFSRLDGYNGVDHYEDPVEKGYIIDGQHPTILGAEYTAQLLSEMGYEPTITK